MSKAKTLNKCRYRPVSEIDEATLASKREYWRTRKREQRAKMSTGKKSSKSPNAGTCKPVFTQSTNQHMPDIPHSQFGSTLLNNVGSYQTDVTHLNSSSHMTPDFNFKTAVNQKQTLCEKIKLNKVVHQFPESSTDSKNCMVVRQMDRKGLTTKESNMASSMVKFSGVPLAKGLPVPTTSIKVHVHTTETQQRQNRLSAFNGNLLDISQQSTVSRFSPECTQQRKPQIKSCVPPRSSDLLECTVKKDQHIQGVRSANPNRKSCAYVQVRHRAQRRTTDMHMTVEEMAAKQREIWRIKKREQRAKRAEKLKVDKAQCFKKGQQETRKLSCVAPTHSLSSVNAMALKKAKQPNSVKRVDLVPNVGKPVHLTVKVGSDVLSPPHNQSPHTYYSAKVNNTLGSIAKNPPLVSANRTNHLQHAKPNYLSVSSGVSLQSSCAAQMTVQSRMQQQRLVLTQRRRRLPQRDDRVETAEERHAKKREYWRIKKQLQRARLSLDAKARLKEREMLKRCAARFQGNLEQMRRAQTSFQRVPQPNRNMFTNASETIGGFINKDGAISAPIINTSARINLSNTSCGFRAVKTSYSNTPSALQLQRQACVRSRSAIHGIPNNSCSSVNIHQRSVAQNISTADPVVRTKLACNTGDAEVLKGLMEGTRAEKQTERDKRACRREVGSSDSASAVTVSLDEVPSASIKQEHSFPSIQSVYSIAEQSHSMDIKDIKPSPSPSPQARVEKEASSVDSNQSTTLLVVASMKKLLEESLSSVADTNTSSSGQDVFLPCKTEDEPSTKEAGTCITPDLTTHHAEEKCNLSGYTNASIEVKRSPPLCHSPPQAPDFSAEDMTLSCQGTLIQLPPTVTTRSSCFTQGPVDERRDPSMAEGVRSLHRGSQEHCGSIAGPQHLCPPQSFGDPQLNERSELERKREYWRTIKRRQRAKKANEKEGNRYAMHRQPSQPIQRRCINSLVHHPTLAKPASHTNLNNNAALTTVASVRPTRLVLSPTASNQQLSTGGRQQGMTTLSETSQVKKWQLQASAPTISTRPATVTLAQNNHIKLSGPQMQTRGTFMTNLKNRQSRFKTVPNQGLDAEEMIRMRRMHWRIKKQEQRAKKAARERELSHQTTVSSNVGVSSTRNSAELIQSVPPERANYLPEQCQTTSFKDEAELSFVPDDNCSDEPLSEAKWRSTYLMDYDPVNQLLVCMVCGELQYCLTVEGVKSHIEEAHPGTLFLEEKERQGILQAWDEQVAVRERFFTNQLWQQSDPLKEQSSTHTAEIEVILDADDTRKTNK